LCSGYAFIFLPFWAGSPVRHFKLGKQTGEKSTFFDRKNNYCLQKIANIGGTHAPPDKKNLGSVKQ